jgi:hypothetical protein
VVIGDRQPVPITVPASRITLGVFFELTQHELFDFGVLSAHALESGFETIVAARETAKEVVCTKPL